ncbi:uncharacterized protein LOC108596858 [Drosophila busckii]|uniref:uncharacterized protein LOC108596858 n=1 Tax=Drosophila busckii TaxID=30019 RepID=UPI00083EFA70|nr:uncharacterized protein LOC108596858 [Drosophila busckii]
MSLVLDVVQKFVLHSAFELSCTTALKIFNKCKKLEMSRLDKPCGRQAIEPAATTTEVNKQTSVAELTLKKVDARPSEELSYKYFDYRNIGPICMPKTSCMRVVRDSYFS